MSTIPRHHAEWLSLLEISGPFLSMPVLLRAFPQGLDVRDPAQAAELRAAYEEWLDNQLGLAPDPALHRAWLEYVLADLLAFGPEVLHPFAGLSRAEQQRWSAAFPEHGETLCPDYVVLNPPAAPGAAGPSEAQRTARLLVQLLPLDRLPDQQPPGSAWAASAAARMQELLHAAGVRLGLLTNGEQWMLVDAPAGQTTGFVSWYAELWFDEPLTLRAFTTLLGAYRFFGVPDGETLEALLAESAGSQQEVTDQLGRQVRRAVELLVQAIDRADRDQGRALLAGLPMPELYRAAVTVMMRLVFLLSAEERGLLPLDEELYSAYYAVSTLHGQLRAVADQVGEEVLEHRHDAWARLLATFRAVYGGVYHDRWHMPAYGGRLFDPAEFPFLEGRGSTRAAARTQAQDNGADGAAPEPVAPLRIDNRTVLHLLESLQYLEVDVPGGEKQSRRLSFRSLDVEQIGHVYEGLLDHTARRAETPVIGLVGTKEKEPEVALADLEALAAEGNLPKLLAFLKEQTGRSESALRRALEAESPDLMRAQALRTACDNDEALFRRVLPWHGLIRDDDYGRPVVIPAGSAYVTVGAERRATGTHYTPRSLTEPIVQHTLEPLVYTGPAEGKPRDQWVLRPAAQLLELKVCDMAMGSGAFLVQACRYLSERLVEALDQAGMSPGAAGRARGQEPAALAALRECANEEERLLLARRLVASRCLYGVDKNPLAVEMAKLSLWLITLDKHRPFTFLDHALKCGDSLVGVDLDQLRRWSLDAGVTAPTDALHIDLDIERMVRLRQEIEAMPVLDVRDQQAKAYKLAQAEAIAHDLKRAGDHLVASYYNTLPKAQQETLRAALLACVRSGASLDAQWRPHAGLGDLRPFHWPLEFPEVFLAEEASRDRAHRLGRLTAEGTLFGEDTPPRRAGFDAFVGNPPFVGGRRIRETLGDAYRALLYALWPGSSGNADYCAFFFLQGFRNLRPGGTLGLIATNTIAQGDTRETGLAQIEKEGGVIFRASNNTPWPGMAAVVVNIVHLGKGVFRPPFVLDGVSAAYISSQLDSHKAIGEPFPLVVNADKSFQGSVVVGMGFVLDPSEAEDLLARDARNQDVIFPYLNGEDLNSHPEQKPSRYVINFFDWPRARTRRGSWFQLTEQQQKQMAREGEVPADYPGPVATDYPDCYAIIKERVYPVRAKVNREAHRKYWWHYGDKRPLLYATIAPLQRVLVVAEVSKYVAPTFLPTKLVFSHMLIVIALEEYQDLAVLNSCFHDTWARQYSSSMGGTLRYTPTDIFRPFSYPTNPKLAAEKGRFYDEHRRTIMLDRWEGLTATYNRFHNPDESAADIVRLRELHVEMDYAVAAAYGWSDLDLGHGFHETQQGIRYTIAEPARREVLARLLALNHARYEEEVKAGLHDKKGKVKGKRATQAVADEQMELL